MIKGARPLGAAPVDIVVEAGVITHIAAAPLHRTNGKTLAADGLVLLPGLVDLHTHLREPGREDAETILTGSVAAASAAGPSNHYAVVDATNSKVLYVTEEGSDQPITSGNPVTLKSVVIKATQPTLAV